MTHSVRLASSRSLTLIILVLVRSAFSEPAHCQDRAVRVQIDGLSGEERRNALATMSIVGARTNGAGAEARIRRLHARAPREIALALQPFGYYQPRIESEMANEPRWTVRYKVTPGPRVAVRNVSVEVTGEGAHEPGFRDAMQRFPLGEGDPLSHAAYELGKTGLLNVASELGYLDGRFETHELRIYADGLAADILLSFVTGPRYRFGAVSFDQDVVEPGLLETFVTFTRGAPFSIEPLLELQAVLSESPYFSRVEVVPRRDAAQGLEVPIEVNLVPRKPQRYEVGVGYGTNSGPRGNVQVELRRLNRRGHRALGEVTASMVEKRVSGRYVIPFGSYRAPVLSFAAGVARLTPSTSTSNAAIVSTTLGQSRGSWQETFSLAFQLEEFEIGATTGTSYLLMPSASWAHTRANDRVFPMRGGRVRLELQGAVRGAGSDASFGRVRISTKLIRPLARHTRVLVRLDLGGTITSQLSDLPPSIRFLAGGDQSVRGYQYRSLGPVDSLGNVIGGRVLAVSSVELEQQVINRVFVAGFFDFGNALDTVGRDLEQGAGGGVRWLSPVGLVRLDLAVALSEPGRPLRLHITVGPDL